jgi:hypothetical protein
MSLLDLVGRGGSALLVTSVMQARLLRFRDWTCSPVSCSPAAHAAVASPAW